MATHLHKKNLTNVLLGVFMALLSGCDSNSVTNTLDSQANSDGVLEKQNLIEAQKALQSIPRLQNKELMVFQAVHFDRNSIRIMLQDPDNSNNVDAYEYRNKSWGEPSPVRLSGGGEIGDNTTSLAELPFERVATMHNVWMKKARTVEGVDLGDASYTFGWNPVKGSRTMIGADIEGSRESYEVVYKTDGSLDSFRRK